MGNLVNSGDYLESSRSQYPSGLRHELSSLARTPGSWVRIPFRAWMFSVRVRVRVRVSVFVLSCI
jgi:hypothetical protein